MSGIYDAPASELTKDSAGSEFGSVERGIAGDYELTIGGVFSEAKSKLSGSKGPVWIAIVLSMVSFAAIQFFLTFVLSLLPLPALFSAIALQALVTLLTAPITIGVMLVGIKLAADVRASGASIFGYFDMMLNLFLQALLIYLIVGIGLLLLVLPGIYLLYAYMYSGSLLVEKKMGIWEAMEASRRAVTHSWFKLFFLWIIIVLLIVVSMIPLMIGLIWTLPLSLLCFGVVYKTLFGVERATLDQE